MTRQQIKDKLRVNLADAGITYYSDVEMNDSITDANNEIVAKSLCLTKKVTLNWQNDTTYYDFQALGVSDYLGCIAIFNKVTNLWLGDNLTLRDFDRIRRDWEIWNGQPQYWAPHSLKKVAVAPKLLVATGQFDLVYWATAPAITANLDVPVIATDMQDMFEYYCTADLLETAEEPIKASGFWKLYEDHLQAYKTRCANVAKTDLLFRV